MKRYLAIEDAADYLGVTVKALRRRVERQEIPHIHKGRWLRFDIQDLDLWMRRHRVDAKAS